MRWYQRFVAKHLRHPTGIFGRRIARRMNAANFEIYELALTNLEIAADDSLLDIGFGGGPAFRQLCGLPSSSGTRPGTMPRCSSGYGLGVWPCASPTANG